MMIATRPSSASGWNPKAGTRPILVDEQLHLVCAPQRQLKPRALARRLEALVGPRGLWSIAD